MRFNLGSSSDFDRGSGDGGDGDAVANRRDSSCSDSQGSMCNTPKYYPNNIAHDVMEALQGEMAEMRGQTHSLKGTVSSLQVTVNRQQGEITALKLKAPRMAGGETTGSAWEDWKDAVEEEADLKGDLENAVAAGGTNNEAVDEAFSAGGLDEVETMASLMNGGESHYIALKKNKKTRAGHKKKKNGKERARNKRRGRAQVVPAPTDGEARSSTIAVRIFGGIITNKLIAFGLGLLLILGLAGKGCSINGGSSGSGVRKAMGTSRSSNLNKPGYHQPARLNSRQVKRDRVHVDGTDEHLLVTRSSPVLSPAMVVSNKVRSSRSSAKEPKRITSAPTTPTTQASMSSSNFRATAITQPVVSVSRTNGLKKMPCPSPLVSTSTSYIVGSQVTMAGNVYEMHEDGWDVVGTCKDGAFMPSFSGSKVSPNEDSSTESTSSLAASLKTTDSLITPTCEGAEPQVCGCANVNQVDYRGSISITKSGFKCQRWDQTEHDTPDDHPEAGLEENFCRNPDDDSRAWCCTTEIEDEWEYCDVPTCEDSLPSAYPTTTHLPTASSQPSDSPSISLFPTTSSQPSDSPSTSAIPTSTTHPSTSLSPTAGPSCEGSNPEVCGCASVKQADYRGSISMTKSGFECARWDSEHAREKNIEWEGVGIMQQYPDDGIQNNNFCRNPGADTAAYCFTTARIAGWEYCNVPYCFPSATKCSSLVTDNRDLQDACDYTQCIVDYGYNVLDAPLAVTRGEAKVECNCPFEIWDCKHGSKNCKQNTTVKKTHECCAKKAEDPSWTVKTASCECSVKPDCEDGNDSKRCNQYAEHCCAEDDDKCIREYHERACRSAIETDQEDGLKMSENYNHYAEHCCAEDDNKCICEYQKRACRSAMETDQEDGLKMSKKYCQNARKSCFGGNLEIGGVVCDWSNSLCNDFPNKFSGQETTCDGAIFFDCCHNDHCKCDFLTYAMDSLGYKDIYNERESVCFQTGDFAPTSFTEKLSLQNIYNDTGGNYWSNKDGWMIESEHCKWFGITCDSDDFVIEIRLRSNNVTGKFPADHLAKFYKLSTMDLANNNLWGAMAGTALRWNDGVEKLVDDTSIFFNLQDLTYIDLSHNKLSGEVDVLVGPALEYTNFSHNNFTSVNSFKKFKKSHNTLKTCDVSYNSINQNASDLMKDVPPNINHLILSNNLIEGTLPTPLENLPSLRKFSLASNRLSGELPDFSSSFPDLQELNLSHQKQDENEGFIGIIPDSLSNLRFLSILILAGNNLTQSIPPVLGNFAQLRVLDLSDNMLSHRIPTELGKLGGITKVVDLSYNMLKGRIPTELALLKDALVQFEGNAKLDSPAPLSLCFNSGFDLKNDTEWCQQDRNALKEIYDSAKGQEWTDSTGWTNNEYGSHCRWQGVTCDYTNTHTTALNLTNNGLSGKLSESIGKLTSLKILDLSDNDLKGSIPTEIGLLSDLVRLRLSYNAFIDNARKELNNLHKLELIQLQSNRISGAIPRLNLVSPTVSSFVADCGVPSAFKNPLECDSCTICCNSQEDCLTTEENMIQKVELKTFETFVTFSWVVFMSVLVFCIIMFVSSFLHDKYRKYSMQTESARCQSMVDSERTIAFDFIGSDSVYQFFLCNSCAGWICALATMGLQLWALYLFVDGAERDLSDDNVDLVYTWKCSRDRIECVDKSDLTAQGWVVFAILMAVHLSKDIINASKLVIMAARKNHHWQLRARFFFGGMLLNAVTSFTLFASAVYNEAIATTNTEIIANAVIILFITDIDEFVYDILMVINRQWVKGISKPQFNENSLETAAMKNRLINVEKELKQLREILMQIQKESEMRKIVVSPATSDGEHALDSSLGEDESKGSESQPGHPKGEFLELLSGGEGHQENNQSHRRNRGNDRRRRFRIPSVHKKGRDKS